ncbi:MAG: SAM-dependent DNA methyltransferase, partial [Verrucomicrobia bacterium]|nr:SAM-dependent DNA methyltransferase [Verrucomicrobiota bacterium]
MSHTSFRELCIRYLDDFQEACEVAWTSGATSTELATRPVVTKFLSDLALLITPSVIVHHEIQVDAKNRPDWWFSHPLNFGVYGYGDHKGLRLNGPYEMNGQERSQIERYMHLGRPVFVFDGLEFLWFTDDINNPIRVELISKPITRSQKWSSQLVNLIAYSEFQTFLDVPGFRKWNETELIQQLAVRARMMANSVESILISPLGSGRDEEENELIDATHELWKILAKHHDPNLRNRKSCADFVAQVLVFGLFFAHTRATPSGSSPSARSALISQFWTTDAVSAAGHLRPFKALVDHLTGVLAGTSDLALWTQQCMQVLAHAEFMGTESGERDFHTLFEGFLEAFDNRIRFDRGAFYTPSALTAWMTRSADHLINSIYGHTMFELAETIIDPCCGTGGFLESLIVNGERAPEVDLPTLVGFEVLPAPYALAHYRLDRVALSENYEGAIRILLTDTLSDNLHDLPDEFDSLFFQELSEANSIVQPPLRVVIGNPPSINSEASGASRREIHDMLEVFRPPKSHRGDRQNVQQAINNEAYRFLRWSAERVIEAGA